MSKEIIFKITNVRTDHKCKSYKLTQKWRLILCVYVCSCTHAYGAFKCCMVIFEGTCVLVCEEQRTLNVLLKQPHILSRQGFLLN